MEGFVPQKFMMDPTSDDLLYGSELANGMVVLPEDDGYRSGFYIDGEPNEPEKAKNNRWHKISKLETDGKTLRYIGIYTDGQKISHSWGLYSCWYVKQDSVPNRDERYIDLLESWPYERALTTVETWCKRHHVYFLDETPIKAWAEVNQFTLLAKDPTIWGREEIGLFLEGLASIDELGNVEMQRFVETWMDRNSSVETIVVIETWCDKHGYNLQVAK